VNQPQARSMSRIAAALQDCYASMEALIGSLSEAEWRAQSLCPDWTVRDVVNHVTSIEAVMTGWLPEDNSTPWPFEKATDFLREADVDGDAYLELIRAVYDGRRRDLAALSDADLDRPSWTPVGPGTYGRFLEIRVFDFWVHERDITVPLGRTTDDTGSAAEIALGEVEGSLGYIVGKKVGLPDGKSITVNLTGPIARQLHVAVDGRAKKVAHIDNPDVTLSTDSTTFIQLACGRIDPQAQIDSGAVTWQGDDELGDRAARNLRFTM
jgi:uncharacterized protein (TIGR03083 family)